MAFTLATCSGVSALVWVVDVEEDCGATELLPPEVLTELLELLELFAVTPGLLEVCEGEELQAAVIIAKIATADITPVRRDGDRKEVSYRSTNGSLEAQAGERRTPSAAGIHDGVLKSPGCTAGQHDRRRYEAVVLPKRVVRPDALGATARVPIASIRAAVPSRHKITSACDDGAQATGWNATIGRIVGGWMCRFAWRYSGGYSKTESHSAA